MFFYHNLIGSQVKAVGTGEKQCNRTCKLHKEVPCGSQLCVGKFVCFHKNWFAWHGGKDEDMLEVFVIKNGIQGCKVGYLSKHLAAQADCSNGLWAHIGKIYSIDCATVVYLRLATGRSNQSRPPGCNSMMP